MKKVLTYLLIFTYFIGIGQSISLKKIGFYSWVKNKNNSEAINMNPTCEVKELGKQVVEKKHYHIPQKHIPFSSKIYKTGATNFITHTIKFTGTPIKSSEEIYASKFLFRDNAQANITYTDRAHGFIANSAIDIAEDKFHHMWIITDIGIVKYDGLRYFLFNKTGGLPNLSAVSILCDKQNRIWVNTKEGFYYIKNDSCFIPNTNTIDLNAFHGRNLSIDKQDRVWLTSSNLGAIRINKNNTLSAININSGLPTNDVVDINFLDNKMYLALMDYGLMIIEKDKWTQLKINEKEIESFKNAIISVLPINDTIYLGTWAKGFIRITENDTIAYSPKAKFNERVFRIIKTKTGIAYSIYGFGIVLQSGNVLHHFYNANGLVGNGSFGILYDSFHNIWVCDMASGISRINENVFFKNQNPYLPKHTVNIRYSPNKKHKWLFLNGDTLREETDSTFILYRCKTKSGETNLNFVFDGYVTNENEVWGASYATSGICKISGDKAYFYFHSKIDQERIFSAVLPSEDNKLWFSNDKIGLVFYDQKTDFFYQKNKKNGALRNSCATLKQLPNKELVCLYDYGMQKIAGTELLDFCINGKTFNEKINNLIVLPSGEILLPTETNGLLILKNNEVYVLNEENGLVSNDVRTIYYDDKFIWLFTNKGIERLIIEKNKFYFNRLFDANYGVFISEMFGFMQQGINGCLSVTNGTVYDYHKEYELRKEPKPIIKFERIFINNNLVNNKSNPSLSSSDILEIKYSFINWGHENEYTHFISLVSDNKDTSNIQIANLGQIKLNDLSPGNYTLQVLAKKHHSNFYSSSWHFIIKPHWYNAWWFRLMAFVLFCLSFVYLYKRKQMQNQKLEAMVAKQTEFLQKEKLELEEKNHIIQTQNKEKDALIQEVHHRVKNNLQLIEAMMKMQLNSISDENKKEYLKETSRRINAMSLVHEMLYNKDATEYIILKEYLLELTEKLKELISDKNKPVKIELDLNPEIKFNITSSVAIGMITSEIISNAIKYAFKEVNEPKIVMNLDYSLDKMNVVYLIKDNGPGISNANKTEGLGTRLIDIFARQIEAEYVVRNSNGLEYEFKIPLI